MSNIVGGGKGLIFFSPKMYEFQFENFKNTKGGSKFFENVYIKTITQTTFKISYLQIYLYLSLPKYIYFHFDLFKWIFSFSEMGHFRSLSGMVSPHKKSLNFQNVWIQTYGRGGAAFFKNVWTWNMTQVSINQGSLILRFWFMINQVFFMLKFLKWEVTALWSLLAS